MAPNEYMDPNNRHKNDLYVTPPQIVWASLQKLPAGHYKYALDIGCGYGAWGRGLVEANHLTVDTLVGVDIEIPAEMDREPYYAVEHESFSAQKMPRDFFTLVIGNPPYADSLDIWKAARETLVDGGLIAWLLPLKYLQGQGRFTDWFKSGELMAVYTYVERIDFSGAGSPHDQHALYIWQKGGQFDHYQGGWITPQDVEGYFYRHGNLLDWAAGQEVKA